MFLDKMNLYGFAQSQKLPYDNIQWYQEKKFLTLKNELINNKGENLDSEGDEGYIFDMTLNYPEKLHDIHVQYPFLPTPRLVSDDKISQHTKNWLNGKPRVKSKKLIADLNSKNRYIVHYKLLKYALNVRFNS